MRFLRNLHTRRWIGLSAVYLFVLQTLLAAALAGQATAHPLAGDSFSILCSGNVIAGDRDPSGDQPSQHPNTCSVLCTSAPPLALSPLERIAEPAGRVEIRIAPVVHVQRVVTHIVWVRSGASRAPPFAG